MKMNKGKSWEETSFIDMCMHIVMPKFSWLTLYGPVFNGKPFGDKWVLA